MLAEIWFFANGIRKEPPFGDSYRPHLVIKGTEEYLGVQFTNLDKTNFLEHTICDIKPLYDGVDYSKLIKDTPFEIKEGKNTVGEGFIK